MRRRALWVLGIVFVAAIAGAYVGADRESLTLDDALRKSRGGEYVQLSDGVTHYELTGPEDRPVVLLIHGGTIPHFAWDAQVPALVGAGFRVLRYTQFGRGYSDRPDATYERELYQRQLRELLDALDIDGRVNVVGMSFGAATAATFAKENPDRVDKVAFIAPVVDYSDGRALFALVKIPLLGDWFVRVFGVPKAVARATGFFDEANAPPSYAEQFDEQTRIEGFERALLSFSRSDALTSYRDTYAALGDRPKLLLWGALDEEIPRAHVDFLRNNLDNVTYVEFPDAGHGVSIERKDAINARMREFLVTSTPGADVRP
jgi:pimeloyl-ACP methyl ester carboxylesterase